MSLTPQQQFLVEQRIISEGPNVGIAYLLWFFAGLFGAHRFYLGQTGTGVTMLILTLTGLGLLATVPWTLVDTVLIPDMARQHRDQMRQRIAYETLYGYPYGAYVPPGWAPQPYPAQPAPYPQPAAYYPPAAPQPPAPQPPVEPFPPIVR